MVDWIYDALESFQSFMDKGSLADLAVVLLVSAGGGLLVVAIHEGGHALAVLLTGNRVHELRVGNVSGYVTYDGRAATPRQVVFIALAGPAANVLGAALMAPLAARADGMLSVVLALWMVTSLVTAIGNLRTKGDPENPAQWSDGRWVQVAWAARRTGFAVNPPHVDPNAATSVPPPGR